jgi:hypothetical protein
MAARRQVPHKADCSLNDKLTRLKFRVQRPQEDMLGTLICLAGDVDRYLQYLERGEKVDLNRELSNMRSRLLELKEACE